MGEKVGYFRKVGGVWPGRQDQITEAIWSMICKIGAKRTDSNSCPVRGVEEMTDTSQSSGGVGIEVR